MGDAWLRCLERAVELRHRLHRQPELAWQEQDTAALIRDELDAAGISWRCCATTGTVATLAAGKAGRHLALRADIDALPIVEQSGVPWASLRPGLMHACGHDGHTATLMAVAWWLQAQEELLPGPVSLLFQPAEEGGHGAQAMIEDGALTGVDAIFGWHNWPGIACGRALCPDGTVMCANGDFSITLRGCGGHASQPERCRDPVLAAAAITMALQQIVSRRSAPQDPTVVSVAAIEAASAVTVIPDSAALRGSIRAISTAGRERVARDIIRIAEATAAAYDVSAEVTVSPCYGATVNHPDEAQRLRHALAEVYGPTWQCTDTALPLMASEDFSYYLAEIPGAFAILGAGLEHPSCHNPAYDFNDKLIATAARVCMHLVGLPLIPSA